MKKTEYTLSGNRFGRHLCFAIVSDLHGGDPTEVLRVLAEECPDFILMPGDIFERLDGTEDRTHANGFALLRGAARIAPTLYSTGNHEDGSTRSWCPKGLRHRVSARFYDPRDRERIAQTGAILLEDSFVCVEGIAFGGLASGLVHEDGAPSTAWLSELCAQQAPRVLLCHHPEYYPRYLSSLPLDLIVSGHAHGGQWRFFGRGVFAPGQGIFPKYTAGVHDDRLVVSTGLKPSGTIPRIFNPPEIVFIRA